jgi:hypothetical protein
MTGYAVTLVIAAWFWFVSPWLSPWLPMLAIAILALGVSPILEWLRCGDEAHPLPEVLQLTFVPFYALPLISEHDAIKEYPEETLLFAALVVASFQMGALVGAKIANYIYRSPAHRGWLEHEIVPDQSLHLTIWTLTLSTAWLFVTNYTRWVPSELAGTLRAIFFGLGTLSTFIQSRMWGSGRLTSGGKLFFVVNIILQIVLNSLSLLLITGMIVFLLSMVGYFSTARRVPWIPCLVALLVFSVLHNGKHRMREIHWNESASPLTLVGTPTYLTEWVGYGLGTGGDPEQEHRKTRTSLFQRASLIHIVSYVVEVVPAQYPHFNGSTYSLIPPQIFPRFLWHGKPSPNDSVKRLSVGLGLMTEEEAESTSIGFGLVAEAYVNFGFYSTALLGLALGWLLRWLALRTAVCGPLSLGGILRILALAWCLNTENTLAVWLSSFYQACVAIFVPLLLVQIVWVKNDRPL